MIISNRIIKSYMNNYSNVSQREFSGNYLRSIIDNMPDEDKLIDLAELFRIFGDSTRIRILFALLGRELAVSDIADALGMSQSAISHQLRLLKTNGLVRYRREGKSLIYALSDEHVSKILNMGLEHIEE